MNINAKWLEDRKAKGEVVGGGWFVFRRGKKTGRIGAGGQLPFEHGSYWAAVNEAVRLADAHVGETFQVFGAQGTARSLAAEDVENVERKEVVS